MRTRTVCPSDDNKNDGNVGEGCCDKRSLLGQQDYEGVTKLQDSIPRVWVGRKSAFWSRSWILHQDDTPMQNVILVPQFLAKTLIPKLVHASYSPACAPCDFYLFPALKIFLKRNHFQYSKIVNYKTADIFSGCFQARKARTGLCVAPDGRHFEQITCRDNNLISKVLF